MSRTFVREIDETFESLPDRPVSAHQNLVTPEGLVQIEAMLARLRQTSGPAFTIPVGALTAADVYILDQRSLTTLRGY